MNRSRIPRRTISPWSVALFAALLAFSGAEQSLFAQNRRDEPQRASGAATGRSILSKNQLATIQNEVVPAYRMGNSVNLLKSLAPFVIKPNEALIAAVDQELAESKVVSSGNLLTGARLATIRAGSSAQLPKPTPTEQQLVYQTILERLEKVLAERETHPALQNPLPTRLTFEEYEELFRKIYVLANRLIGAKELAMNAGVLGTQTYRSLAKVSDPPDFEAKLRELLDLGVDLGERQLELRVHRLVAAKNVLEKSPDIRSRIFAAYALDLDGEVLKASLQPLPNGELPTFQRPVLRNPNLLPHVTAAVQAGHEAAGDLSAKSRAFFEGMDWWMRGRYGRGVELSGLMKSPLALRSPAAQVALSMPFQLPTPSDPFQSGSYSTPEIDRRHHYHWDVVAPQITFEKNYFM